MSAPRTRGGIDARPADTLLIERARDFLAGGAADSTTLIRRVCQLPNLSAAIADQMASELLSAHPGFVRSDDGRWRLAPPRPAGEAGAPGAARTRGAHAEVPSFEEWLARRAAARAARQEPEDPGRTGVSALDGVAPCPDDDDRLSELSYAVVDVETTGGTPQRGHRITEIAAVIVERGQVRDVYETLVNPERPIPPEIVRLTGITMEMVRDKPTFRDVCSDVVGALRGHVFVAHNAPFDWRFVSAEVERAAGQSLEGRRLCTVRLARKLLPQLRSRSLGSVADHYGADAFAQTYFEARHGRGRPWRHSAAGDAVATAHCLLRLLGDAADRGVQTWGELDQWLAGGTGRARDRRRSAMPSSLTRDAGA